MEKVETGKGENRVYQRVSECRRGDLNPHPL